MRMETIVFNNLRKYRTWKNITQKDLAKEIKISENQLRLIECENKYPKYHVRSRLCEYFGVSQSQMFYCNAALKLKGEMKTEIMGEEMQ